MAIVADWVRNLRYDPRGTVWRRRSAMSGVAHQLTGED
jgi:hypothetical protein